MVKIIDMEPLNPTLIKITLDAPHIAKKVKAGQFGILRVSEDGERFPLTIEDWDIEKGTISFVFQIAGASTQLMSYKKPGEYIADVVGPLGHPLTCPMQRAFALLQAAPAVQSASPLSVN